MIRVFQNGWKHTVGIIITINHGALFENDETEGFTHLAEHLMFSGTQKDTRYQLREKHDRLFRDLEATTSREEVNIFCTVDALDIDEAMQTLNEMIFNWKCRSDVFEDEKQQILQEARAYIASPEHRLRKNFDAFLSFPNREILGDLARIQKWQFSDVQDVKRYWSRFLKNTSIDILVVGNVTKKHLASCKKRFNTASDHAKRTKWKLIKTEFATKKNAHALTVSCAKKHPFLLFFGQILDRRSYDLPEKAEYIFAQFQNETIFFASGVDKRAAKNFFSRQVSAAEFNGAKRVFLQRFRRALDGIDSTDALLWLQSFRFQTYADLSSENPLEIYRFFERMTHREFTKFLKTLTVKTK